LTTPARKKPVFAKGKLSRSHRYLLHVRNTDCPGNAAVANTFVAALVQNPILNAQDNRNAFNPVSCSGNGCGFTCTLGGVRVRKMLLQLVDAA
jgi:hypothetical protein